MRSPGRPVPAARALTVLAVLAVLAGASALPSACASGPPKLPTDRYRFDIGVAPVPDRDRALGGTVTATDLATRRALSTPRFEVAWGESATVAAEDAETGAKLEAKLQVDKAGTELTWEATVTRPGRAPSLHRAFLALRN